MRTRAAVWLLVAVASCATTGAEGEGDHNLPTVGVGPFRKLTLDEVTGVAPFVLDDRVAAYREPSALVEADGSTILYVVAKRNGVDVIARTRAADGRAFYGSGSDFGHTPPTVLVADRAWEGSALSGPSALRIGERISLFYAAAGGIGVATTSDGLRFDKAPAPILARDAASPWETTELRAPSAYALPDGTLRLLYASGGAIFEAESVDGVHFTRLAAAPILTAAPPAAAGSLRPGERPPFDTGGVGDPCASVRATAAARLQLRVLYTGTDGAGASAIGFASRFGTTGPLERQAAPVYSVGAKEAAPALAEVGDASYLYVQQERRVDDRTIYTAIAGAFAPVGARLPAPLPFPAVP